MSLRVAIALWLTASAAGAALLALPDAGSRLVAFSDAHGLTPLDALGAAILLGAWLVPTTLAWRRRTRFSSRVPRRAAAAGLFVAGLGCGLLVASVFSDFSGWWAVGAGTLGLLQVAAFLALD